MSKKPDYSNLFYLNPLPSMVYDLTTMKYLDVNQAALEYYGYSQNEFLSFTIKDIWPQKEVSKLTSVVDTFEQYEGNISLGVFTHQKKNGELIRMDVNGHKLDHYGKNCMMVICQDVTEQEKLREWNRQALKLAKIGNWQLNLIEDSITWTDTVFEFNEKDPESFKPDLETAISFFREDFRNLVHDKVVKSIQKGENFDFEAVVTTGNKQERWVRIIGDVEVVDGECQRIYGSYQDIHQRKMDEIQLKTLMDNLPGAVFQYVLYPDGRDEILYISEGSYRVWNLSPKECRLFPEKIWQQIEAGGDMKTMAASIHDSAQNLSMWKSEWRNVSPDGQVRYYEGQGMPQKQADGSIIWNSLILDITDRKLFEQKFLSEQADRISILESISDAFYAVDKEWNITYFNKEAENMLNIKFEMVIGRNIWTVFSPVKGTLIEEKCRAVAKTGKSETFEYWYAAEESWYEVNVYPSNNGLSAFFKNINERKQAAEELKKTYEEKNNILESIGDAFFSVNKDWIITYWNREAENITGKKRIETLGTSFWEIYEDALNTEFYRQYKAAMETRETVNFEEYYSSANKWFEVTAYPSSEGLSVYFKDITLRKETNKHLIEAKERFEKVTEATNDAIWDWDIEKNTFYRSKAIDKFFGEGSTKFMCQDEFWQDKFHKEDISSIQAKIEKSLQDTTCARWEMQYRVFNEAGEVVNVNDRALIMRNEQGKPIRVIGAMRDITERKRFEEKLLELNNALKKHACELESTNEELERFAYIASHDLQEPLRMVTSFMNLLKKKYDNQLDERAQQYISFASEGAKRMKQIILDLLEYSRAGKVSSSPREINMNIILEDYQLLRKKIITEKNAQFKIEYLPTIQSYSVPITQTLHALLDNAIKYSKENEAPLIHVYSEELPDFFKIVVKDNGIGIDPKFYEKIFIVFQRLHQRDQYSGSGIGLSIAKKQIESCGGEIYLESKPDVGSKFSFTVPKHNHKILN
jgi:PAS domain S-box-containing protein